MLQFNRDFRQLSHHSIQKLLTESSCDACLLEIDIDIGRIIEDFAVAGGSGGNHRRTRDLSKSTPLIPTSIPNTVVF